MQKSLNIFKTVPLPSKNCSPSCDNILKEISQQLGTTQYSWKKFSQKLLTGHFGKNDQI